MNVSDILGKLNFRKKPPVADPLAYAREKYGQDFTEVLRVERWKDEVVSCTTGRFEKLGKGYVRHCGPTAITNLILTLNHRGQYFEMQKPGDRGRESAGAEKNAAAGHTPEEIFLRAIITSILTITDITTHHPFRRRHPELERISPPAFPSGNRAIPFLPY